MHLPVVQGVFVDRSCDESVGRLSFALTPTSLEFIENGDLTFAALTIRQCVLEGGVGASDDLAAFDLPINCKCNILMTGEFRDLEGGGLNGIPLINRGAF